MSRHIKKRPISTAVLVRQLLAARITKVSNPSAGAPPADYKNNPWLSYAELTDVFTPPPLDKDGNPIREVAPKEWREDPRSLKGWTEMNQPVEESAEADLGLKL